MKKRSIFMIIGGIIVLAAIAISLVFVFSGNDSNGGDITDPPAQQTAPLTGTWRIVANYTKDVPVFVENQYISFTDTQVSMYKDATGAAYATSSYTVNEANQLILPDIGREYKMAQKSDNCIRLYDGTDVYMLLIRNSSDNRENAPVTTETLAGKWNVAMKGDEINNGEMLEFTGNTLNYYKAGNTTPAATVDFTLANNLLNASAMGLNMHCYKVSDSCLIFVQDTGIVWELVK